MVKLLAKMCLKNVESGSLKERQVYGMLCGIVGIILNVLLFFGKFTAGTLSHSIAITADAFNNLSDAGASVVTLIGFKLAAAKPNPDHPFGHGRIEYVSGLIVSAVILIMAFELLKSSIEKILHPQAVEFSMLVVVILIASILVKLYMSYYNRTIGTQIASAAMKATALDSLSDTVATIVVLAATLIAHFTGLRIDGWCGIAVAIFIFYAGFSAAKDTLSPLLGQAPESEFVEQIQQIVMNYDDVQGIHDLIVHDYGPGRVMISLHAEVPAEGDILALHDMIDNIERELKKQMQCDAVIHMDPVVTKDIQVAQVRQKVQALVEMLDPQLSMHDFRMVAGPSHTNLIFDVVVPHKYHMTDEQIRQTLEQDVITSFGNNYFAVIEIDKSYAG